MQAAKDQFGRYVKYASPNITGYEEAIKATITAFADTAFAGASDDEKRVLLNQALGANDIITAFVMENLPEGLTRVDGVVIRPLLKEVVEVQLALLPEPSE